MNPPAAAAPTPPARHRLLGGLASLSVGLTHRPVVAAASADPAARPWHHLPDGTFRNPPGSPGRGGTAAQWRAFAWRTAMRPMRAPAVPEGHVRGAAATLAGLAAPGDGVTWLGHACFLLRLGGRTILTDPYLSHRAAPVPWFGPARFAGPSVPPENLPPVDLLLLSHNHYDHLDLAAIERLPGLERADAVMPLRVGRYLDGARRPARALEVDWLQRVEAAAGGVSVTALPAIHFSKRGLFDRNASLWCGYLIEAGGRIVLFTGDTAYGPVFREVAAKVPRPELALVPIGAYAPRELMEGTHCAPEEGVRIARDFQAPRLCGMHWGAIQLTDEDPFEPPGRFREAARAAGYAEEDAWVMAIGETRTL